MVEHLHGRPSRPAPLNGDIELKPELRLKSPKKFRDKTVAQSALERLTRVLSQRERYSLALLNR